MSEINVRREALAKGRPFRLETARETQVVEIISTATGGTFSTNATSLGALLLKVNGTAVKIPFYTA